MIGKKQVKRLSEGFRKYSIYTKPFTYLLGSFIALYGLYEVLDFCEIDVLKILVSPFFAFLFISISIALIRFVIEMLTAEDLESKPNYTLVENESDSLIEMLKEAEENARWAEIIKLCSALSDFLWYTSRKTNMWGQAL